MLRDGTATFTVHQENVPTDSPTGQSYRGIISIKIFPQYTQICVKLTKTVAHSLGTLVKMSGIK